MAASNQPRGRGRGRGQQRTQEPGLLPNDVSTVDVNISPTHDVQTVAQSQSQRSATCGRGRGHRAILRKQNEVPDPMWTVSNLSQEQFYTNDRPSKPTELGTVGQPIRVRVNYFPILQFPQKGDAYHYDFKIQNKRGQALLRKHRRLLYECWLGELCRNHPEVKRDKIAFDNETSVFTYEQRLPGIDEHGIINKVNGPNRANRQEEHTISIKQVAGPINLSVLGIIKEFYRSNDGNISVDDLERIKQMLSVALHENCSSQADFIFNRSYFSQPLPNDRYNNWDIGLGKAIWRGFYSCLIFTKGTHQLLMNLDVSHKVFTKRQPFLQFLCEVMRHSPCGKYRYPHQRDSRPATMEDVVEFFDQNKNYNYYRGEVDFLLKHCKDLSVRSKLPGITIGYTIYGLGESASTKTFYWKQEKKDVTVENYYRKHHNEQLKYPTLPCLEMYNGSSVPMEILDVMPINVKKITDEQRAILCLKSSQEPSECRQSIQEIRQNSKQQHSETDPFVAAWNLNVDANMLPTSARILPMPDVICNNRLRVTHTQCRPAGVWISKNSPFCKPAHFPDVWGIINLTSSLDKEACEAFYNTLSIVANSRGMDCPEPVIYKHFSVDPNSTEHTIHGLDELMRDNSDCRFYIVILPEEKIIRDRIYGDIKMLCELEASLGIITQMIQTKKKNNIIVWDYSKLDNILLKVNTKLNGINSSIAVDPHIEKFFSQGHRIMYVGIDLSHAAPGSGRRCSAVAIVASASDIPNRYFKEIYVQERPERKQKPPGENQDQQEETQEKSWEFIADMKDIMESLINQYKEQHSYPPNAIIMYRDGISTSEFDTIFEKELTATREACVELSPVYRPCLTYIVVNKRHHTRFFPENSEGNVSAGTVVDSPDVTDPTIYDFYLNSHHGQKGTSRPAHYRVLYDDNKLHPNQVQTLTYALCYLHARCTRSISIPAPVKYADLLAYRAGIYGNINGEPTNIPINQSVDVSNKIRSERIVLSSKLEPDCPFFL